MRILAAASLRDALEELALAYEEREETQAPVRVTLGFGASSTLRVQIEEGAPADVFLSADTRNPGLLHERGLAGEPRPFARKGLAIVVPVRNPAAIGEWRDLARPGVRIVGALPAVPISAYVDELLDELEALPGAPDRFADRVRANVVSREDDVRAILAKVELGEADAGIVYRTDARAARAVDTVSLPAAVEVAATYAAVALGSSPEGTPFVAWLAGPPAQAILAAHGFQPP